MTVTVAPASSWACLPATVPPSPVAATRKILSHPPKQRQKLYQTPPPPPPPEVIHQGSMVQVMTEQLDGIDLEDCEVHGENAFFVCDLATVWRANERWHKAFNANPAQSVPVEPFYAVKCNPDPTVITLLGSLGVNFDCASQAEIELVLSLGISPSRIIYANPCKAASYVRHAASANVKHMTFDNLDELDKVAKYHPSAKLLLRILTNDAGSLCQLSLKFGAPLTNVPALLARARELNLDVVGVSFHVGSGCSNPLLYDEAIASADWVFQVGQEYGYQMDVLDIGGGFGGDSFEPTVAVVRQSIDRYFPKNRGVRVIAEPGRFYVAEAFELATNIIARRKSDAVLEGKNAAEAPLVMYYINDGVYGAFNCTMFDHQVVEPELLTLDGQIVALDADMASLKHELSPCSIWGPTCDSIDVVSKKSRLPTHKLRVGDWLRWANMGAYTICAASQFNGFRKSIVHYTIDGAADLQETIRKRMGF